MTNRITVFDTTLRDGEQAAGTRLGAKEKLEIARQLVKLNVDVIEAGFPQSSPEDFRAVELIAAEITGPIICGLTRAVTEDIDTCAAALSKAQKFRIHTGIGVSDIHIAGKFSKEKYGKSMEEKKARILEMCIQAVRRARVYTPDVEFYAEDAARAEPAYLIQILQAVIEAGATVVNIPDTTGYAVPEQFGRLIRTIRESVPNIDKAVISVHCHNDLGLAVSNTLAAVKAGARQVEGTINGIGERAGNAAIEEIVMGLRTRRDYYQVETTVETRELRRTSRLVADLLNMPVPPNKAVVGENAFSHSSGIHVDGVLKMRETYEIMKPEEVGFQTSRVILTARTGRHGLRHRLEELGHPLSPAELETVYRRFLNIADKKQQVFDEDLIAIVRNEVRSAPARFAIEYVHAASGTGTIPTATVRLLLDGAPKEAAACGDGPVDAVYKAIQSIVPVRATLLKFEIHAVTGAPDSLGEVKARMIGSNGKSVIGRGVSTDIVEASAMAYVDGLNQLSATSGEMYKEVTQNE